MNLLFLHYREIPALLLVLTINIELELIVFPTGFRHCAEDTVAFPSGDNSHIIVLILFQLAASVFPDFGGSGGRLCVSGEVPAPFAGRVGRQEDIVSIATVDDVP